jgi:hypothetical protein
MELLLHGGDPAQSVGGLRKLAPQSDPQQACQRVERLLKIHSSPEVPEDAHG